MGLAIYPRTVFFTRTARPTGRSSMNPLIVKVLLSLQGLVFVAAEISKLKPIV